MWYRLFSKIYKIAAKGMCYDCRDFIREGSKILDLGCGSAIIAKTFRDFFKADVLGVDIADRRIFPIRFKLIDGENLPFVANNFDTVLITYVLHHSQKPIQLLKEAKRVVKDKIIIYEDLPEGDVSEFFCKIHGGLFDIFFQKEIKSTFKTEKEWLRIFQELNLKLIFQKKVSSRFDPVKKKLFVLEKP
jgi:ubiquinone/menaquinone biosynthesis C-methylase UbiE